MSRHEDILALIQEYTFLKVEDACSRLGVSPATVRRDFAEMEQLGLLKRVTGGAIGTEKQNAEELGNPNLSEKRRIAEKAVSLVSPGDTLFLDSGSTNTEIAKLLSTRRDISVITNSITIAYLLDHSPNNISVFICGGNIGDGSYPASIVGPAAEVMISQFRANTFFMGAYSVHPEFGVTDPYVLAAGIKRKMIQSATRTILVADYTKFGKTSKSVVCSLDQVDRVITDDKVDGEVVKILNAYGCTVDIV